MAVYEYGYTSKVYPFGSVAGHGGLLPSALPTKMIVTSSYVQAPGETVKIKVTLGKTSSGVLQYMTVLQDSGGGGGDVNLLDQEIDVTGYTPSTVSQWSVIIKASIIADENTDPQYNASEPVELYCYYDVQNRKPIVRVGPNNIVPTTSSGIVAVGSSPAQYSNTDKYQPLSGVQVMFYAKDTTLNFATVVSDRSGRVSAMLPPGSYDVKLYGGGFSQQYWLAGDSAIAVGSSDLITRFGSSADDIQQQAEFGVIKAHFASTKWIGYFIPEDFTSDRQGYRNESADPNSIFGHLANQDFGTLFRGASLINYIGVAFDPAPV